MLRIRVKTTEDSTILPKFPCSELLSLNISTTDVDRNSRVFPGSQRASVRIRSCAQKCTAVVVVNVKGAMLNGLRCYAFYKEKDTGNSMKINIRNSCKNL